MLRSFPPVAGKHPKILILGSMPSKTSLQKNEYYGYPRNHFWPVMFALLKRPPTPDYAEKTGLLKKSGIALWDVLKSCERDSSLDKDIQNETTNDIPGFIDDHPSLQLVVLNGQKAYHIYRKHFRGNIDLPYVKMPSTSPVPRKHYRCFKDIYDAWRVLTAYIEEKER